MGTVERLPVGRAMSRQGVRVEYVVNAILVIVFIAFIALGLLALKQKKDAAGESRSIARVVVDVLTKASDPTAWR